MAQRIAKNVGGEEEEEKKFVQNGDSSKCNNNRRKWQFLYNRFLVFFARISVNCDHWQQAASANERYVLRQTPRNSTATAL